jgi:hypothetical protein
MELLCHMVRTGVEKREVQPRSLDNHVLKFMMDYHPDEFMFLSSPLVNQGMWYTLGYG